ncbi:hypothetical protein [Asaia siamensis]|nr:hypothetical protein [Asaia siamensis]
MTDAIDEDDTALVTSHPGGRLMKRGIAGRNAQSMSGQGIM